MATIRLTPSTYYLSNSTYLTVSDASNMYADTDSTTYGTVTNIRAATTNYYIYLRGFNFNDIPAGATINSFTIKLKARERGVATSTTYRPYLCNNTTTLTGTFSTIGTTATVLTCTGVTASFDTIKGYGANFGIRINCRRAASGTTAYMYIYGAEIEVDYTPPATITFDANGGTGTMADDIATGGKYTLPSCTFTAPAGRDFDGWQVDGTRYAAGTEIDIAGDTTVTALWTYIVSFVANGGTGTMASDSVSRDDTGYPLPDCTFTPPAGYGMRFDGWLVGGTKYAAGNEIEITGDTTVTATWTGPELYYKSSSGWVQVEAGYEKNTNWTQKNIDEVFQSGHAYKKGN